MKFIFSDFKPKSWQAILRRIHQRLGGQRCDSSSVEYDWSTVNTLNFYVDDSDLHLPEPWNSSAIHEGEHCLITNAVGHY